MQHGSFDKLIGRLRVIPRHRFPAGCVEILSEPIDWPALARDRLAAMADAIFIDMTRRVFVDGVEPKVFLLHDDPSGFRIVLNYFDRQSFDRHLAAGRITPHYHHYDFSTRIIHGQYHHLLYANEGTLNRPQLSMWHRTKDQAGDVYFLPWDEFHCVLAPAHDTVSLQIRGSARILVSREPEVRDEDLLAAREAALKTLAGVSPAKSGTVPAFAHRWLAGMPTG